MLAPYLLSRRGPGAYVGDNGEVDPGVDPPIVTDVDGDVTITTKVKPGSFGKFVYPLATVAAGRRYIIRVVSNFAQLTRQGDLAMVGFGFKTGNDFHITGLRGDGAGGTKEYIVHGTPPGGWNKQTGHTEVDNGAAAAGTQHSAYFRLTTASDGASYTLETSADGSSWSTVVSGQALTPFSNVSGVITFGVAFWFNNLDTGVFSTQITEFVDDASGAIDGLSGVTGAWSAGRALLSSYGGSFVENISGAAATWYDQSGNARNFTRATAAARPTITTGGPNSRAMLAFNGPTDGTSDSMDATAISNFISNSAGYFIASIIPGNAARTNFGGASIYLNDSLMGDVSGFIGLFFQNGNIVGYNYDGSADIPTGHAVSDGTAYVIEWWHESGNLNTRLNGGTTNSVASGNTSTMTGTLRVGTLQNQTDVDVFEMVVCSSVPSEAERNALVANMLAWVG